MDQLRFTIPEILSLIGVTQCVYILVYMIMRARHISRAGVPLLYFSVLGFAFLLDFARNYVGQAVPYYEIIQWAAWFYGPPLSVLLILQITRITKSPEIKDYGVILFVPAAFVFACVMSRNAGNLQAWLTISGLVAGAVSLLVIWMHKGLFEAFRVQRGGKERYWLILSLVFMNVFFLGVMLTGLQKGVSGQDIILARTVLGLSFVYLANTSLFRIFPRAVRVEGKTEENGGLSDQELDIALKIEKLIRLDKVYQEAAYSRADLARECNVSEALLSRIINIYFKKSFPQLINENRIEDAKRLLVETDAPVHVIGEETGFNALPSFNRVFKEMTGESPSGFRKRHKS